MQQSIYKTFLERFIKATKYVTGLSKHDSVDLLRSETRKYIVDSIDDVHHFTLFNIFISNDVFRVVETYTDDMIAHNCDFWAQNAYF